MATDMWTMINRELEKVEKRRGGVSSTPYVDIARETMRYAKEDRAYRDRKNLQRQNMMQLATEGWEGSTDVDSLGKMSDWIDGYLSKNRGNMDDITLEYADLLKNQIGNRNQRIANLHTDADMLEQSKEQWLGIAYNLKDRPLGQEDYNDLSASIGQFIKMKQDMLENNADFLALPQFEYIKQDMVGQEYVINEILSEAKDHNVFSKPEYEWTTTALRDGNYSMLLEKKKERIADKERTMADLGIQIDSKMDLHRRIQIIKDGGRALLPEIIGDAESTVGLEDLGFEQLPSGEWVPVEPEGKAFGRGITQESEKLEGLRSDWSLLAGAGNIQGSAERDLKNLDLVYERESGTGNKYTLGKYGFENFYADPSKPAETQDDNYKHISDNDGFINVNNAVDQDPEGYGVGVGEVVVGAGAAGAVIHANWDKISKTKDSALKYLKDVGFLLEDDIAKLYSDPKTARFMDALNKQTDKLNAIDKNANPKEYLKVLKKHQQIVNQANKHLFPMFNEKLMKDFNNAEADLRRIIAETNSPAHENYGNKKLVTDARNNFNTLQEKVNKKNKGMLELLKNPGKWNLWKMKAGRGIQGSYRTVKDLVKIGGKTFGKLTPLDAAMWGWWLGDKAALPTYAKGIAAGTTYYSAKSLLNWMSRKGGVTNALMNPTLQSKIGGYLIRKAPWLAAKMGLKMGAGIAGTVLTGGLGTAFGVTMAAWTGKDIYNLIQDVPEIKQYIVEYLNGDYDEVGEMRKKGMTAVGTPGFLPK